MKQILISYVGPGNLAKFSYDYSRCQKNFLSCYVVVLHLFFFSFNFLCSFGAESGSRIPAKEDKYPL